MNNRRDLRSRFKKLAGLDNTKPSISIPSRKMLSEARVSKLLSDGYSYTDIVLMEQTWLPAANAATDPTAMANLITNRENSIGYLNAAMPTRKSLLALFCIFLSACMTWSCLNCFLTSAGSLLISTLFKFIKIF